MERTDRLQALARLLAIKCVATHTAWLCTARAAVLRWLNGVRVGAVGAAGMFFVGVCVPALMSRGLAGQGGKLVVSEFCGAAVIYQGLHRMPWSHANWRLHGDALATAAQSSQVLRYGVISFCVYGGGRRVFV